jgi:signal transduction histidine kinase/tetratricopeptide (TPR) repeat protein
MRMEKSGIQQQSFRENTFSLLGGRFQKHQWIDRQGAVQSWRGMDLSTGDKVVLKTAPLDALQAGAFERTLRDDAVLRDLRSPWLSPPIHCALEGALLFRVLPCAPEGTLAERLAMGPLSVKEALQLGRGLLRALQEAHAHGVLHRHLAPSRVVIPPEKTFQEAMLTDFGLALEDLREHCLVALPIGAIRYLSPEQLGLMAGDIGPASDLYAAGLMLFEGLAGAPPFPAKALGDLLRQHLSTVPELRAQGIPVPRALEQVVQHLLSEEPRERYQSATAALSDLEDIASEWERGIAEPTMVAGRTDHHPSLTEPAFIERTAELEGLAHALSAATQGRGGLVLLEGESGGGKTMLLDELERRALASGARVFRGQAIDRAAPQPLQTLLGVFKGMGSAMGRSPALAQTLRAFVGTELGAACSACPELAELLGVPAVACQGPESLGEARMVRTLAAILDVLGDAEFPALVLLDDCQWSDELTLKLLASLGKSSADASRTEQFVTVVAAFRTEEVPAPHPLRRMAPMFRVSLAPFTASDLRGLAEAMAGSIPDEALDIVVQLSEGNPFMASAMVRGLVECGALLPTPLGWRVEPQQLAQVRSSRRAAALLLRRLDLFSPETRSLLTAGAILGREFEVGLAAVLARQSPEQAVAALEEARQRHLLWVDFSKSQYTFAHDRIREALLEQLPADGSCALHLAAALELERRTPERSFELAWHFEAARKPERAWPHALKSAEAARRKHALDLAERYYRLADAGALDADTPTRIAILEGLGDILCARRRNEEAEQSYLRAQAFATTRFDRARLEGLRGESALRRADMATATGSTERALRLIGRRVPQGHLSRAVCLLWELLVHALWPIVMKRQAHLSHPMEEEELLAARLHTRLSQSYWFQSESKVSVMWAHLRGLNIAERYAPTPELATAYTNHGTLLSVLVYSIRRVPMFLVAFFLARGRKYYQKALALREAFGDAFEHGLTLSQIQFSLHHYARHEENVEVGRRAVRLLQQAGVGREEWRIGDAQFFLGFAFYHQGDLTKAVEHGQAMYRVGRDFGDRFMCSIGLVLWASASGGQIPAELVAAELARPASDAGPHLAERQASLLHAEGIRLLRAGEPGQAAAILAQSVRLAKAASRRFPLFLPKIQSQLVRALREQAARVPACAFSLRAELLRQAKAAAREVLRRPFPFRENLADPLRESGLIAAMEGKNARARQCFDRSLAIADRLGLRYERALTLLARAEVGTALGWADAAQDAAAAEEALRPMRAALEPATAPEAQASLSLVDRFPRILEAGRAIASALTREAVLSAVREATLELLRGEESVLVEATSEGLRVSQESSETVWPFMHRAREQKQPVVPSTEELESTGYGPARSALCAPILVRGQVAALCYVTNHKLADAFGPQELRIAEFIATLAGAALENAQGFAEVKALSEERGRLYQEAQAALSKRDEFLAVASHELRTPFTPMLIYLQGLLSALRNPAKAASLGSWITKLETANARLQRLAKLVEDLFDVSRLAQSKLAVRRGTVDLAALTAEAVDRWKDELARVQCECTLEAPAPIVGHWDGLRLEQVIDNLLGNATRYGPGQPISLRVEREGTVARLTVQDRGMGIAPEDQARIFERFERAVSENYGGFGLGLWSSREVVQAHGGRISVESTPGQGATFTVELPLT